MLRLEERGNESRELGLALPLPAVTMLFWLNTGEHCESFTGSGSINQSQVFLCPAASFFLMPGNHQ